MERRMFIAMLSCELLAITGVPRAQPAAAVPRVAVLLGGANPRSAPFYVAFEHRLNELGWVDGHNLAIDFHSSVDVMRAAEEMVRSNVNVIVVVGPEVGIKAASGATKSIPIVMVALNYDPAERGYVRSLARPGGNITGIYSRTPEIGAKQLELLHEALPRAERVGVLWSAASIDQLRIVEAAGTRLHLDLANIEIRDGAGIERAFVEFGEKRIGAVLALGDPINFRERARIGMLSMQRRLPVCGFPGGVEEGFLLSFGADLNKLLGRAAEYVDKILKGAKPSDLPIEQPTKFELVINLKVAKTLGLTVPQSLLLRADEVIQ